MRSVPRRAPLWSRESRQIWLEWLHRTEVVKIDVIDALLLQRTGACFGIADPTLDLERDPTPILYE